jgi:hypothetical protein
MSKTIVLKGRFEMLIKIDDPPRVPISFEIKEKETALRPRLAINLETKQKE